MNAQAFLLFFVLTYARGQDRQITPILNPGCDVCTDENPLVYIKANSSQDTIHQIWDFTRGIPTVIYTIASRNSTLNITWDGRTPSTFALSEKPTYSFAVAIDKIYEYDDIDDNGYISPKCPQQYFSLRHLSWHRKNDSVLTEKEALMMVHAHYRDGRRSGTVDMKLDLLPFKDYADSLPRLIHTANSSLIDIRLVNLTSAREYNATRFALHLLLVSTDPWTDSWNYTMRKSLDDEHTPGMFEIIEIKSPKSSESDAGGFLQFRPVAYTEAERDVSSSTNMHISNFNRTSLPPHSTLRQFYSAFDEGQLLAQDMFVSFGLGGDGFYKQHNYTAWSFTLGYGKPPIESFSLFVIVIISIGLGVPVLLAVSGVSYVLVRRYRQRNPPTRLTNDE